MPKPSPLYMGRARGLLDPVEYGPWDTRVARELENLTARVALLERELSLERSRVRHLEIKLAHKSSQLLAGGAVVDSLPPTPEPDVDGGSDLGGT